MLGSLQLPAELGRKEKSPQPRTLISGTSYLLRRLLELRKPSDVGTCGVSPVVLWVGESLGPGSLSITPPTWNLGSSSADSPGHWEPQVPCARVWVLGLAPRGRRHLASQWGLARLTLPEQPENLCHLTQENVFLFPRPVGGRCPRGSHTGGPRPLSCAWAAGRGVVSSGECSLAHTTCPTQLPALQPQWADPARSPELGERRVMGHKGFSTRSRPGPPSHPPLLPGRSGCWDGAYSKVEYHFT